VVNINRRYKKNTGKLSIIPLGGIGEIGKNMYVLNYNDEDIIVVDAGLMFPEEDMLGIDSVIPDIKYLEENRDKVRAIVLTHGHEDHIGGLPYVLRKLQVPVYGTRLTLGLVEVKLKEHHLLRSADLRVVKAGDSVSLGAFNIDFIRSSHSITDTVILAIDTPLGMVVLTSDFKIDQTPVDGQVIDYFRLAELGQKGVLCLLSDSTNAERPGYTLSEKEVGKTFEEVFVQAKGRIIVATFASNIHRVQQVIDASYAVGRKVAITGRSMVNVVNIAKELGYMNIPDGMQIEVDDIDKYAPHEVTVLTTGSQGEPMSALTRMSKADHKRLSILPGDTVIISATPIPGNEKFVGRTIDNLFKLGADVIYEKFSGVHVSGHASQEELKLMLNLIRPQYFVPVHGEYRMLVKHKQLAMATGVPEKNVFILENGDVLEFTAKGARKSGKVPAGSVMVDGLGVGDVGNIVLRDRRQLSEDGILIVVVTMDKNDRTIRSGPDIITRGFVYVRESEDLIGEATAKVKETLEMCRKENINDWSAIKSNIRDVLYRFLYEKTKRRPMILPIIMEV
jgi:ribonuclease J